MIVKADIDAVKQAFVDNGKLPLNQTLAIVAKAQAHTIPEFPRAVRDLVATAQKPTDYPDWSALSLVQIAAALDVAKVKVP